MKIKENIFNSISKMNANELAFLYDQVRFMEKKRLPLEKRQHFSIDQILQMTASSESKWSDAVIEELARTKKIKRRICPQSC